MKSNHQQGAAVVEFALILPVLLVLLFGLIEFALLFYNKAIITNASREGARAGIVFSSERLTAAQITETVNSYIGDKLVTVGGTPVAITSTTPANTADLVSGESELTVTVSYQYGFFVLPALFPGFAPEVNLVANTTMRAE